ncbi:MAG TPA: ATP-binding protein [Vicinamibacterales bacterium]|nr:ATP-binding protein [Vicinamibacterales bacterium]
MTVATEPDAGGLAWTRLPRPARLHVAIVTLAGLGVLVASFPRTPPPWGLFFFSLAASCVTSAWKINLPIPLSSGSTLSMSYAADLMALLLLGPRPAIVIAVCGVWTQCTINVKRRYPLYRTAFSIGAEAITMAATGIVYQMLGGSVTSGVVVMAKPIVASIATYFCINTGLVAGAIATSTGRRAWIVWREDFLWSAASFMAAGSAGAAAAMVIARGQHWAALLLTAPVYLVYWTYRLFVGRLEEEKRHLDEMTRLEQARAELLGREQAARASAESANRLKDQFLATVSHELRTPLSAILGWAEMLQSGRVPPEKRERATEAIFNNAKRQAQLIDELLDVARIISGKLRLEYTAVDPQEIVNGALETVQPAAEAKGIRIDVAIDPAVVAFHGDGPRLQQVLWNLLSNAVKFTPEGGTVSVAVRLSGHAGEMVVRDSGPGIPRDFLPSVFEPFRQADGSRTRLHGGLGLGLAIVKQLVEAHGGTVHVDSAGEGLGATFSVRLPAVAASRRRRTHTFAGMLVPTPAPATLTGLSVLVVDDDDESRSVVTAFLESHGAGVLTARSASEALDILQRDRVDVLLADVAMPGEDGYTLVRKLRALQASRASTIPAAALTAFAREEDRQEALQAGFQMHLTKPIDAGALVAAVATLVNVST